MMFGVGPGPAHLRRDMLGIDPDEQRRMMEESFDVIMAPVPRRDRHGARPTGSPSTRAGCSCGRTATAFDIAVAASISPSGPKVGRPPRHRPAVDRGDEPGGFEMLAGHWKVMEEQAAEHGTTVDRSKWRMMGPMHIAETEQQALDNCRYGLERVFDYLAHVVADRPGRRRPTTRSRVKEMNETGSAVIGTPEMAIAQIQRLVDQSGGFGASCASAATSPTGRATMRSYELFAQYVMPHFQGQLEPAAGVLRLDRRRPTTRS